MNRHLLQILIWFLAIVVCSNSPAYASPSAAIDAPAYDGGDPSVEAGREALDHWRRYPWYDAEKDALRRVDVAPPKVGFWEWFWGLFPDFNWASGGGSSGTSWGSFLQVLAIVLISIVAILLVYFLVKAFRQQKPFGMDANGDAKKDEQETRARIEALPFPVAADMSNLLEAARHYRQREEYGEAAKYLFSYQLIQLDRYGIIRLTRGKTNRQYLREMGRGHELCSYVERTMWVFEEFFFGDRVIEQLQFETCWSGIERFDKHLVFDANRHGG